MAANLKDVGHPQGQTKNKAWQCKPSNALKWHAVSLSGIMLAASSSTMKGTYAMPPRCEMENGVQAIFCRGTICING
jgi:hypothetical protein